MNLKTFIQRMDSHNFNSDQNLIIEDLRNLANDRTLLSQFLYQGIQENGFSTAHNLYNAYAFVLHSCDAYTVRLGFWAPVNSQDEGETFIYHLNHTHDFEIYCVGYAGDGYTTVKRDILDHTALIQGVRPRLGEETESKLAPGAVLHMKPLYEIHRQLPPEHMSASLSLIIHAPLAAESEEAWCFDENYVPTHPGIAMQEIAFYEKTIALLSMDGNSLAT